MLSFDIFIPRLLFQCIVFSNTNTHWKCVWIGNLSFLPSLDFVKVIIPLLSVAIISQHCLLCVFLPPVQQRTGLNIFLSFDAYIQDGTGWTLIENHKNRYKNITGIRYIHDDCSVRSCKRLPYKVHIHIYINIYHISAWPILLISNLNTGNHILFFSKMSPSKLLILNILKHFSKNKTTNSKTYIHIKD